MAYRVHVVRKRGLRQQFHVRIESTNGEVLLTSEKYRDLNHAVELATDLAKKLHASGVVIDER
jgi:uncharacterized protein YegP (UPF0339 family)